MNSNTKNGKAQDIVALPVDRSAEALIAKAIENKVDVATMERLLAMRRELKAEWAKEEYVKALAAFQAECPVIKKTKAVFEKDKKTVRYKYAPIDSIIEQVKGLLAKHGFSYTVDALNEPGFLGAACRVTHSAGHSEVSTFRVPVGTEAYMSDVQKYGARNTFAKRYAFTNAFGILTGDEDTDASGESPEPQGEASAETYRTPVHSSHGRITYKQAYFIRKLLAEKGYTEHELCVKYGVPGMGSLMSAEASQIIENLQRLPDAEDAVDVDEVAAGIERERQANGHMGQG